MQQNPHDRQGPGSQTGPLMDAATQAGQEAMKVAEQARQEGFSLLDRQKSQASEALRATGKAVEEMGHRLQEEGQGTIGEFAAQAARQVGQFSEFLDSRDVEGLFRDLETVARRQPAYFLGGAFVLGFLGARFLKSSAQANQPGWRPDQAQGRAWSEASGRQPSSSEPGSGRRDMTHQQRWGEEGQSRAGSFLDDANEPTGSYESPGSWRGEPRPESPAHAGSGASQERRARMEPPPANGRSNPVDH